MQDVTTRPLKELAVPKGLIGGPFGSNLGRADYTESGVPVIRGQNLSGIGSFSSHDFVYVSEEKANRDLSRNLALPNDVVFTQRGTLGQVGIVPSEPYERYVISQSQMRLRVDSSRTDSRYVYYCFRDPAMVARIHARAITTGVPHINLGILADLPIPVHPLPAQQAIAEVLGALDDKIAVNERIAATSLNLGGALLEKAVQEESSDTSIGGIAELIYGKSLPEPKRRAGDAPVFGCTGQVGWHDTPLTPSRGPVVGRKGANAGHVSWMSSPGWVIDTAFYARPLSSDIPVETLYFILNSAGLKSLIGDSAVPGLNRDLALRCRIRIPAARLMSGFRDKARGLLNTSVHIEAENHALANLRNTLIPQLITGKIHVKDAVRVVEDIAS
ncbi:restriction endonuclease subunit S [Streptomyces sp. NPDC012486]|uniref:restriction endonuclease subunit S n=1 Tax=Streptomyces sp. NPDC012486 TaxID=3156669 RepID=UPI0033DB43DD